MILWALIQKPKCIITPNTPTSLFSCLVFFLDPFFVVLLISIILFYKLSVTSVVIWNRHCYFWNEFILDLYCKCFNLRIYFEVYFWSAEEKYDQYVSFIRSDPPEKYWNNSFNILLVLRPAPYIISVEHDWGTRHHLCMSSFCCKVV